MTKNFTLFYFSHKSLQLSMLCYITFVRHEENCRIILHFSFCRDFSPRFFRNGEKS